MRKLDRMPTKICAMCQKSFVATGNNQKTCGSYRKGTGCSSLRDREARRIAVQNMPLASRLSRNEASRLFRLRLKEELFQHYGKVCICCGEGNLSFLTFDHRDNDGFSEKKEGKYQSNGTAFHLYLRRSGFPDGIQIMCWNCNCGKRVNGGVCPHEKVKAAIPA